MNSTLEVIFGLLGGLAVFIFGMNMMSDCLQKAKRRKKMKRILALLTKNPILGVLAGALTTAVLQSKECDNRYGDRFCKCRTDESAAGNLHHPRSQHRNDDDGTDHCL